MSSKPDRALVILMVAGEPSGDAHGAELILAMKERNPKLRSSAWAVRRWLPPGRSR
jgi:lipid A disaccharide synthetase